MKKVILVIFIFGVRTPLQVTQGPSGIVANKMRALLLGSEISLFSRTSCARYFFYFDKENGISPALF